MEIEETETENFARQIWYVQLWSGTTCPLPSTEATAKAVALIKARDAATEAKVREECAGLVEKVAQLEEELGKHIDVDKEIARVERELGV
jgi:hypothetical protein